MDDRSVVTVFLTHESDVLLLRRSDEVGSYAGRWGAVAGHVEDTPEASARTEIREETGLELDEVSLIARGDPFTVSDTDLEIRWTVHPFRFDTGTRRIETNWETDETIWVQPPAIPELETVPDLWRSWDRVRPTVDSIREDTEHGSATISKRALEVLRDEATRIENAGAGWEPIETIAAELRAARDDMAVVRVRIDRAMSRAISDRSTAAVRTAAIHGLERAFEVDGGAAERAMVEIEGRTVFTLSRSGTVERALRRGTPATINIAESRPGCEGRNLAAELLERDLSVTLFGDANLKFAIRDADVVLVGADTVLANGDVINKAGTFGAALVARWMETPVFVVSATDKISPETDWEPTGERSDASIDGTRSGQSGESNHSDVPIVDPAFERTPAALVDGYLTENGRLDPSEVERVSQRHADLADWRPNR